MIHNFYTITYLLIGDKMDFLKRLGKSLLISMITLFVLTFIMTLLNYINLLKFNFVNIMEIIILFVTIFSGSFYMGKRATKKGWLEGIKFGCIFLIILILFNYLGFNIDFEIKNLVYYIILLASSVLGGMIGISFKVDNH